jgi:hypothetical protein
VKTFILFLFQLFTLNLFAQVNMNLGLRAYYPFNGNANDVSGNNNHPVFNNASLTTDRFGNPSSAYLFNGTSNYMRIPNSPSLNTSNQLSLTAWVKVNGFYQGTCHGNNILMKGDNDPAIGMYLLRFDDYGYTNAQNCAIATPDIAHQNFYGKGSNLPPNGYTPYITQGQWISVVYTNDGATARLYVDCQLKIATAGTYSFTNAYDLYFGRMNHATYPYWFNGVMDEIRIYDRALNQDEVNWFGGCGSPDLTSSQFFTSTQLVPATFVDEVIALRNVGSGATSGQISFTITNYSALTGLSISQINPGNTVTIGMDNYIMDAGWTYNSATGTFTSTNIIPVGMAAYIGIRISRGVTPNQGANGIVTQTTTIGGSTGGGESPVTNNSISNHILKY